MSNTPNGAVSPLDILDVVTLLVESKRNGVVPENGLEEHGSSVCTPQDPVPHGNGRTNVRCFRNDAQTFKDFGQKFVSLPLTAHGLRDLECRAWVADSLRSRSHKSARCGITQILELAFQDADPDEQELYSRFRNVAGAAVLLVFHPLSSKVLCQLLRNHNTLSHISTPCSVFRTARKNLSVYYINPPLTSSPTERDARAIDSL